MMHDTPSRLCWDEIFRALTAKALDEAGVYDRKVDGPILSRVELKELVERYGKACYNNGYRTAKELYRE